MRSNYIRQKEGIDKHRIQDGGYSKMSATGKYNEDGHILVFRYFHFITNHPQLSVIRKAI